VDIVSAHALTRPHRPAVICGEEVLTYAELDRTSNRVARVLQRLGARPGGQVAVVSFNSGAGMVVSSALRKLHAVGVPVNFRLRGEELAYVLNDSRASVVCAGPELVERVEAIRDRLRLEPALVALPGGRVPPGWADLERLMEQSVPDPLPEPEEEPGMGATMIYTSGTTGHPKGAYRPEGVSVEEVLQVIELFTLRDSDVHLMAGPGYHSAVAFFAGLTTVCGGTVVVMPHFHPEEALRLIERHRVTTTFMAPILFQRMVDLPDHVRQRYDLSSLRVMIMAAAPCPFALKQRICEVFGEVLWEFYGATETGINTVLRPEEQLTRPGSVGRVAPGNEILLLDDGGRPVADGQPGELWVRNRWLASYFERPDATAKVMRDGFFSVGDVAYRDQDGYYYICDRKIDLIISGGVNIYPAEVEACLFEHPAVADVAVIGVPDPEWGEAVKAVVQLRPGTSASEAELIEWCRLRIADYKRPRSVDFVDELPRDQAGKLLKRQIREPYWTGSGRRI
jgi:acyl-CoA synthetase (AMP-forming)/AMP-acid ligase II